MHNHNTTCTGNFRKCLEHMGLLSKSAHISTNQLTRARQLFKVNKTLEFWKHNNRSHCRQTKAQLESNASAIDCCRCNVHVCYKTQVNTEQNIFYAYYRHLYKNTVLCNSVIKMPLVLANKAVKVWHQINTQKSVRLNIGGLELHCVVQSVQAGFSRILNKSNNMLSEYYALNAR